MAIDKRAGQPAQQSDLINVAQLTAQYYVLKPEVGNAEHAVKFGTSGHRGSAARHNFNEQHILAIAQAIAEDRAKNGITGPCYVGKDTHALSEPAFISVLEVLAANGVDVIVQENNGFTPTPAISNAPLTGCCRVPWFSATLIILRRAFSIAFWIAAGTSRALP